MDTELIKYLRSGECWMLVGSGPSNEMLYPSWKLLAERAAVLARQVTGYDTRKINGALTRKDYPMVFQLASDVLGLPVLVDQFRNIFISQKGSSRIYETIARWPIPVYLTTN